MAERENAPQGIFNTSWEFIKEIFNIQDYIDKQKAREEILGRIDLKGVDSFILIATIMVASIGLNADSVAVVIGAMLIFPLMGPIVGLGYSVAVNDWVTLRRSLINFGIMVVIALLTSSIYFALVPLKSLTSELQSRIEPTSLDVMIAFFGGFAGIAAVSSKMRNINVIAGVAIATALMPPLCTAGYGIAMGTELIGYKDFTGFGAALNAMYLFFINSIFIGIATFLFVKFSKFPLVKFQNPEQARRTNWMIAAIAILTIIPSSFIFFKIVDEEIYHAKVRRFLSEEVETTYPNAFFDIQSPNFSQNDSMKFITISTISERIPQDVINTWNTQLKTKHNLKNTNLVIHQGAFDENIISEKGEEFIQSLYASTGITIQKKDSTISALKSQISSLNSDTIPFYNISQELKSQYPNLDNFGYAILNYRDYNEGGKTMMPSFTISWKDEVRTAENAKNRLQDEKRIQAYLQSRLKLDTLQFLNP